MFTLVYGGAASGKSEFAESLAMQQPGSPRIYIATMELYDEESRRRAARHLAMREGKGFTTMEQPRDLHLLPAQAGSSALLECLSTLTANECFGGVGAEHAAEHIIRGLDTLLERGIELVAVTGALTSDGIEYGEGTEGYLAALCAINIAAAKRADRVYEVVDGIPNLIKGEDHP